MNDLVVGWCRIEAVEVTRSRAYHKNDQAWVEQKNGAIVRRLVGYVTSMQRKRAALTGFQVFFNHLIAADVEVPDGGADTKQGGIATGVWLTRMGLKIAS